MTISIRLDPETETLLRERLRQDESTLSTFVRAAIRDKLALDNAPMTAYEIGEPLFGRYASGEGDRSMQRKKLVRERVGAKHRR